MCLATTFNSGPLSSKVFSIPSNYHAFAFARLATAWSCDPHEFGSDVMQSVTGHVTPYEGPPQLGDSSCHFFYYCKQ